MRAKPARTLLVVYHRPFWRGADGSLWEREGAFSRYVESLAPHFDQILLAVPEAKPPAGEGSAVGHRLLAENVELAGLPYYDGLPRFARQLPAVLAALWRAVGRAELVNLRVPTPAGGLAYLLASLRRRSVFLLVVGDLTGVAASVPADSLRRRLYHGYVWIEERLLEVMVRRSLTIANGRALYEKHAGAGRRIFETRNSTIRSTDIGRRRQQFSPPRVRLLCVSRIDPRKGLRFLPAALAALRERGLEPSLEVLGPTVGRLGEQEKEATQAAARQLGVESMIRWRGAAELEQVAQAYTEHDVLVVPSLPGEGIPRVILEAMAAGLPVVATSVAGIPSLVRDGQNGLLVPPADGTALGLAVARLVEDEALRQAIVEAGYETARQNTAEAQGAWIAEVVREGLAPKLSAWQGSSGRLVQEKGGSRAGSGPPRVSIPLAGLNLSGGVKSLLLLANRLVERGAAASLIVPDYAATPPVPIDERVELRVLRTAGPGPLRKLRYFAQLGWEAAADADVVVANYFVTAYPVLLSWLLQGRRAALAYNVRGYEPWSHGLMAPASWVGRWARFGLAWFSYRLPFRKLVTTDWLARMVGDRRAVVVGHGIDLEIFQPTAEREQGGANGVVTIGVIGRLGDVKGYPDFLRASELLPSDLPLRYLIVQADPVEHPRGQPVEALEARTEAEMVEFYRRCDVFVFPSLAEGFGLPALEALACGCALVTTDCGGVATFARPEENCLMVPPGQPGALAAAIERLSRCPELRARLRTAGLATVSTFDRRVALDRLVDVLLVLARQG